MAKVIGIGGIFFKHKNPSAMKLWYQDVLGMTTNDYGVLFEFNGGQKNRGYLQLGTFDEKSDYFGADSQQAMINFRVDDLVSFQQQLISKKVKIVDELESFSYGKFLHIEDPDGNRIELWEPIDSEFEDSPEDVMPMN